MAIRSRTNPKSRLSSWTKRLGTGGDLSGVDHYLVQEVHDVLNRVTRSVVVVKSWSCELLRELALQDLFRERRVK